MKSFKNIQKEAVPKKLKKENALDIKGKSLKNIKVNYLKSSDSLFINDVCCKARL